MSQDLGLAMFTQNLMAGHVVDTGFYHRKINPEGMWKKEEGEKKDGGHARLNQ